MTEPTLLTCTEPILPVTLKSLREAVAILDLETDLAVTAAQLCADLEVIWTDKPEQRAWITDADGHTIAEWAVSFYEEET